MTGACCCTCQPYDSNGSGWTHWSRFVALDNVLVKAYN